MVQIIFYGVRLPLSTEKSSWKKWQREEWVESATRYKLKNDRIGAGVEILTLIENKLNYGIVRIKRYLS